jgi:hypothetical protein
MIELIVIFLSGMVCGGTLGAVVMAAVQLNRERGLS